MAPFREKAEGKSVGKCTVNLIECDAVMGHFFSPVTVVTRKREHLEEMQDAGYCGLAEDIGPGAKEGTAVP